MSGVRWQCPYCSLHTTINEGDRSVHHNWGNDRSKYGRIRSRTVFTSCPNPDCAEVTTEFQLFQAQTNKLTGQIEHTNTLFSGQLLPEGQAMHLPEYIPEAIRRTYREAALVRPISGAASAALSRRCLQGMVRDFFEIPAANRGDLGAELAFVKNRIDARVWEDIFAVRSVGDIGAHMDRNVDFVVDVEPDEADLLVKLIEELFRVWYIERERRNEQSAGLQALLAQKRRLQKKAKEASKNKNMGATVLDDESDAAISE